MPVKVKKNLSAEEKRKLTLIDTYARSLAVAATSKLYKDLVQEPDFTTLVQCAVGYVHQMLAKAEHRKANLGKITVNHESAAFVLGFVLARMTPLIEIPDEEKPTDESA